MIELVSDKLEGIWNLEDRGLRHYLGVCQEEPMRGGLIQDNGDPAEIRTTHLSNIHL
jgi:hypothetical protein